MNFKVTRLVAAGAILLVSLTARAQSIEMSWYTFAAGAESSGGGLQVRGSIQFNAGPASGAMIGGDVELVGGFWTIVRAAGTSCGGFTPCDTNCDGSVNGFDINGFILALGGAPGSCSPCNSDTNGDGSVNGFDVEGFIDCLGG